MFNKVLFIADKLRFIQSYWITQSPIKKLVVLSGAIVISGALSVLLLFVLVWSGLGGEIANEDELSKLENPVATEVYSSDSVLLGRFYIQERSDVRFDQLPSHIVDALIVTEDVRFYEHGGIDYKSFLRVFVKSILLRGDAGGGSTLTQQLAKNLYPRKNHWFLSLPINKIRELILASRLENVYDKNSIITLYLNTVSFGDNAFGIEAAAQRYFSKHVWNLSIEEGATLIGMLKATHYYNPRIHPDQAKTRRNVVLSQLAKYEKLDEEVIDSLQNKPLEIKYSRITHHNGLAPYFREYIRKELLTWCKQNENEKGESYNLYTDGLKVYTTIDSRLQLYAEQAMEKQMTRLQDLFNKHWGKQEPWHKRPSVFEEAVKKSDHYERLKLQGKSHDEIIAELSKPTLMNIFTWKGEQERNISPLDSIKYYLKFLNSGALAMDPHDGAIKVWVGGINHNYFQYDHVKETTKRQVGSTIKPIVYATALEKGEKPCAYISAEKTVYDNQEEERENWAPSNTEENYHLKYSMEGGLAYSVNTVAVHVLEKAGIDSTITLAHKMGIKTELPAVPSLALGTPSISVMEMVTAYSCLVNNGYSVKSYYITSITDVNKNILERFIPEDGEQALEEENAQLMVEMMKRSINEGTAASLRNTYKLENDIAGKTGTTQSYADGWFMAMTPNLVVGVWVGADDPAIRFRSGSLGSGAATALPIAAIFFQKVNGNKELIEISQAKFPELSSNLARRLNCDLYKEDNPKFFDKLFGRNQKDSVRQFGETEKKKKSSLWKKLFKS